jgi:hypothetical protein
MQKEAKYVFCVLKIYIETVILIKTKPYYLLFEC